MLTVLQLSERPGFVGMEQDTKYILQALMGEPGNPHVDAMIAHLETFLRDIKANPTYREFVVDAEEVLEEVADTPEVLEDPATRLALKGMYKSAINILRGMETVLDVNTQVINPHIRNAR